MDQQFVSRKNVSRRTSYVDVRRHDDDVCRPPAPAGRRTSGTVLAGSRDACLTFRQICLRRSKLLLSKFSSKDFVVALLRLLSETFDHASHQAQHCARRTRKTRSDDLTSGNFQLSRLNAFVELVKLVSSEFNVGDTWNGCNYRCLTHLVEKM